MSKNDPIEVQVQKMREWATGVAADLKDLQARLTPDTAQCDAISVELAELYEQQDEIVKLLNSSEHARAQLSADVGQQDEMEVLEAQASLNAAGTNPVTGKAWTVAQCTARAKIALNGNARYQELLEAKRGKERELASVRAVSEELERQMSLARGRGRALVARLENLTARIGK